PFRLLELRPRPALITAHQAAMERPKLPPSSTGKRFAQPIAEAAARFVGVGDQFAIPDDERAILAQQITLGIEIMAPANDCLPHPDGSSKRRRSKELLLVSCSDPTGHKVR